MVAYDIKKISLLTNFSQKVVMDYRQSKIDIKDFESLRQKFKQI